jgi:phage tail-like protein
MAVVSASVGGNRTAQRVDPFATFKFHVEIGDIKEAAFDECSGLEMSTDVKDYEEGGLNEYVHKLPGRTKHSNVTLKRGLAVSNELFSWFQEMEECLLTGKPVEFRKVTITLNGIDGQVSMNWTLSNAFPVKWSGPGFKAGESAVAIETLEFAHHGIKVEAE